MWWSDTDRERGDEEAAKVKTGDWDGDVGIVGEAIKCRICVYGRTIA